MEYNVINRDGAFWVEHPEHKGDPLFGSFQIDRTKYKPTILSREQAVAVRDALTESLKEWDDNPEFADIEPTPDPDSYFIVVPIVDKRQMTLPI